MKITPLSNKLLLLLADLEDVRRASFSINSASLYLGGHPALHKHRKWMEEYLINKKKKRKLQQIIYYLKKRRILRLLKKNKKIGYVLTDKGKKEAFSIELRNREKKMLLRKNLLLIFYDIPETMRIERDYLRRTLRACGFYQIQKSIWASRYDVAKDIKEYLDENKLRRFAHLLLVKEFSY